jgi:hypothetical protein
MADPFHKAEAWRSRAGQLRDLASRTRDPVVSISLAGMAERSSSTPASWKKWH